MARAGAAQGADSKTKVPQTVQSSLSFIFYRQCQLVVFLYHTYHSVVPVPRCLRYLDTIAIEMHSISSHYTVLFPLWLLLALSLVSNEFILYCWALAGSSCASCTACYPDNVPECLKTAAPSSDAVRGAGTAWCQPLGCSSAPWQALHKIA